MYLDGGVPSFSVNQDGSDKVVVGAMMTTRELRGDRHMAPVMDDHDMLGEVGVVEVAVRVLCLPHHQGPEDALATIQTCWGGELLFLVLS